MNLAATISLSFGGQGSGCQGPNCGRHRILFHGTSTEIEKKVKKQGLVPQETNFSWTGGKAVYLTDSPHEAWSYAKMAAGNKGKPVVLAVDTWHPAVHRSFKPDREYEDPDPDFSVPGAKGFITNKTIPYDAIRHSSYDEKEMTGLKNWAEDE